MIRHYSISLFAAVMRCIAVPILFAFAAVEHVLCVAFAYMREDVERLYGVSHPLVAAKSEQFVTYGFHKFAQPRTRLMGDHSHTARSAIA